MVFGDVHQYRDIELPMGRIRGCARKTIYNDSYFSFDGIPYAQPPVGNLRFKAPLPVRRWMGIKDCMEFQTKPIQKNPVTGEVEGSEDCLYLNVYAKNLTSAKPLPVMVWIYGGSFLYGEATKNIYSPDYFMTKDVVVVTMNYRLCSLGFLSLKDASVEIPGNAGLKDQILALNWVKDNIQLFNGDPNNITLFGNSSGASCVHYLTATNQAKGLFNKAICMSGTVFNSWSITQPKDYAFRLAKQHGYKGFNVDSEVLKFLLTLEAGQLICHDILDDEDKICDMPFPFGPCIEPYECENNVINDLPRNMLKTAWGNGIPIIMSGTSDEGLVMYPRFKKYPQLLKLYSMDPEKILPPDVREVNTRKTNFELAKKVLINYIGNREPEECDLKPFLNYSNFYFFWHGFHRSLLSRLNYATAPTYLYRFSFDSATFNHERKRYCRNDIKTGAAHADDVSYMWYSQHSWKLNANSHEYKTIFRIIDILVNFAKNPRPNVLAITSEDSDEPLMWKPLEKDDPYVALNIGKKLEVLTIPEKTDLSLWNSLYSKEELF